MAQRQSDQTHSRTPSPPPWSPVTPGINGHTIDQAMAETPVDLPPNIPISESTNTDVIALRAALSLLQLQRLRSAKNIETLDKQRKLALAHPEEFCQSLVNGSLQSEHEATTIFDENEDSQDDDDDDEKHRLQIDQKSPPEVLKDFGKIPAAIQVVRCPPVNWSKYHIAGEVLDQLHERQCRYPESGQISTSLPSRPHSIAAPYSPWQDKLTESPESKKSPGS